MRGFVSLRLPSDEQRIAVFIGLTPFTSGFLVFVRRKDVIPLDLRIEDAAELVVSGGLVCPTSKDVTPA